MNPILESDEIVFEIIELADSPQEDGQRDIDINYYIDKVVMHTKSAVFEECENEDETVKLRLIHNIQYSTRGIDADGDTPIIRIFTLENKNSTRYFTALGTDYALGLNYEYTKEKFITLLDSHQNLKNNHLTKYLKNTIFLKELEKNLSLSEVKNKKPKL